jgi:UDP-glucose:(heptosyl)LPS alpha-1,3-glucosyltransferase
MKIGFVTQTIHRRGGQDRAALEVLIRLARHHEIVVAARLYEPVVPNTQYLHIRVPVRPALLTVLAFRHQVSRLPELLACDVLGTIGAGTTEADVVTAQFCHAAFTSRFGGLRGRGGLRGVWQKYVQKTFTNHERKIYSSGRLRRVIAVSKGTARELCDFYGVDPAIIRVIPNAVDHDVFKPAESVEHKQAIRRQLGIDPSGLLAVFVGGDWDRKGVADAIRAVGRTKDLRFAIVGHGDIEAHQAIARDAGAGDRVRFVGPSPTPQLWLAAADLFIFPSRYEAFSLVTIEAAACGLPLVATKINGSEELIEDGVNGIFIQPDPDSIATALQRLYEDDSLRTRMGAAAHQSSLAYTWDSIAEAHRVVYEEVARMKKA